MDKQILEIRLNKLHYSRAVLTTRSIMFSFVCNYAYVHDLFFCYIYSKAHLNWIQMLSTNAIDIFGLHNPQSY